MKKVFLLAGMLLFISQVMGQIGGLSGSKLASYCVNVVKPGTVEFEPSFSYTRYAGYWDDNGELKAYSALGDTVYNSSGFAMRFTYGLFDKMEVGISVPTIMDKGYLGVRYILFEKKKLGVAAIAGMQVPLGNGFFNKNIHTEENTVRAGFGGVFSYSATEKFSMDANLQYNGFLKKTVSNNTGNYTASMDVGYYIFNHTFQLIGALYYENNNVGNRVQDVLTVLPGFTVETGKSFIIVASVPFSVYGHNISKGVGFSFALTLTFN